MKTINTRKIKNQKMISGAIFDFLGFLTTLEQSFSVGGNEDPTIALDKFVEWAKKRGLDIKDADVTNWDKDI